MDESPFMDQKQLRFNCLVQANVFAQSKTSEEILDMASKFENYIMNGKVI